MYFVDQLRADFGGSGEGYHGLRNSETEMGEARTVFPDDFKFNRDVFKGICRYFPGIF